MVTAAITTETENMETVIRVRNLANRFGSHVVHEQLNFRRLSR